MERIINQILNYEFRPDDFESCEKEYNTEEIKCELIKSITTNKDEIAHILYKYFLYSRSEYLDDKNEKIEFNADICDLTEEEFLSISKKDDFLEFIDVLTIATSIDERTNIPKFIIDFDTK